jgi:hypothetical protein
VDSGGKRGRRGRRAYEGGGVKAKRSVGRAGKSEGDAVVSLLRL